MRGLASLEIRVLVRELGELAGGHIKKFYDLGGGKFMLSVSKKEGTAHIFCSLPNTLHRSYISRKAEETPSQFAMSMRKLAVGCRITGVVQHGTDRIIEIIVEGQARYTMVFELFGKGNVVLVDEHGAIALVYSNREEKSRSIRRGAVYVFPEAHGQSVQNPELPEIFSAIELASESAGEKAIKALARHFDIGTAYLEDALARAGIDPNAKDIPKPKEDALAAEIHAEIASADSPAPVAYVSEDGRYKDFSIKALLKYGGLREERFQTLGEALDAIYEKELQEPPADPAMEKAIGEIRSSIEKQERLVQELAATEKESALAGGAILRNMHAINELIGYLRSEKKPEREEAAGRFPLFNITDIDLKDKEVVVELEA
jgi:predicted ribosome quality control (RQC) complex YloA/Tae2 family protein